MSAKPGATRRAKAAAQRLAVQLGKTIVGGGDESGDDSDDDVTGGEGGDLGADVLLKASEVGIDRLASAVAAAMPQVVAACTECKGVLAEAVETAKAALDSEKGGAAERALHEATTTTDRDAAIIAVEGLLKLKLAKLLDEVF
eukprot:6279745-Prymnesium_polylepis.1